MKSESRENMAMKSDWELTDGFNKEQQWGSNC